MNVFEIPLSPHPQTFSIALGGVQYNWRLYWLMPAGCWVVNIADQTGSPIINGIPLVTGVNLLGQYGYTAMGKATLFVRSDQQPDAVPDWNSLGTTGHLYYLPPSA